ncbi:MAG: hypothetical protein ABI333_17695 [bacterium]
MTSSAKKFRVVVVGVAPGTTITQQQLISRLLEQYPIAMDARLALESGRSAVVQVTETEHLARRYATKLIKLGAEIRIEPESGGPGLMDFDNVELSPEDGESTEIYLQERGDRTGGGDGDGDPTMPFVSPRTEDPTLVDRPPREVALPRPGSGRTAAPAPASGPPPQAPAAEPAPRATRPPAQSKSQLVRCPAHGLLYDATEQPGCSRCLGPSADKPFRLAPELRNRPRLWLTLGLAIGLLLGAVPAALYAQSFKSGQLYELRIEADAIRRGRVTSKTYRQEYSQACSKVSALRSRGMAFTSLIWIAFSALLMLLWYRFV